MFTIVVGYVMLTLAGTAAGDVLYVDARATGANNGSSWDNALVRLYDALERANYGDEIRVAQGVYQPDFEEPGIESKYHATFQLLDGVTLLGGYAGLGASDSDHRDVVAYETILCGYLDANALSDPNNVEYVGNLGGGVYHVLTMGESTEQGLAPGVSEDTVLDGITIVGGTADGMVTDQIGAGIMNWGGNPRIANCRFQYNVCEYAGAAMANMDADPVLINCTFAGNRSDEDGGAIYNRNSNPTFEGCLFTNNQALLQGGAIKNEASGKRRVCSPKLKNCRFTGNQAYGGGAIASRGDFDAECRPRLTDCVFEKNTADDGGAISSGWVCRDTLSGCTFRQNSARYGGGSMDCSADTQARISRCVFAENDALFGGAVLNQGDSEAGFKDCIFEDNTAVFGGAVENIENSAPAFADCLFQGNDALVIGGAMDNDEADPRVVSCRFLKNSALDGGAVCNGVGSDVSLSHCVFLDNIAEDRGGAWYGEEEQSVELLQCMFAGNLAFAGGACYTGESVDASIVNGIFSGNSAELGGAIYSEGSTVRIMSCSLHANTAVEGRALVCDSFGRPSDVLVFNSILWDGGREIWNNDRSSIELSLSCVQGGWTGFEVMTENPLFVDADGSDNQIGTEDDNLHLRHDSPLIDWGFFTYVSSYIQRSAIHHDWYTSRDYDEDAWKETYHNVVHGDIFYDGLQLTDYDGNPRFLSSGVDLGAFEFNMIVVDANGPSSSIDPNDWWEDGSPGHPFDTIEEALEIATKGQTILVLPGHYLAPDFESRAELQLNGTDVIIAGLDPTDPDIVDQTILSGAVLFSGTETPACVLQGFTIQNAEGGIFGNHTRATIRYCNIVGNGPCGATVLKDCDGLIENCLIADNTTFFYCGAFPVVSGCHGLFRNCTIANNLTGVSVGAATLENCILYHNGAAQLALEAGQKATVRYCCIQDGVGAVVGDGELVWGPGNMADDPVFVQVGRWLEGTILESGDYRLQSQGWRWTQASSGEDKWIADDLTSPCIDAGDPNSDFGAELLRVPQDPNNEWGWNKAINMGFRGGTAQASLAPVVLAYGNPPAPDPMQWALDEVPTAIQIDPGLGQSGWGVRMTAVFASADEGGLVNYYFDCVEEPRLSSRWQESRTYQVLVGDWFELDGLQFRVRARDTNKQETGWSKATSILFLNTPPAGELVLSPTLVGEYSVALQATMLEDLEGVEYLFDLESAPEAGSGWLRFGKGEAPTYTFTSLHPDSVYRFRFKARDVSVDELETRWSTWLSLKTLDAHANSSLMPDPMTWAEAGQPKAVQVDPDMRDWGWGITMTAAEVTDGKGGEVYYLFDCKDDDSLDSGWLDKRVYAVSVGHKSLVDDFLFRVMAKNANGEETEWSEWTRVDSVS